MGASEFKARTAGQWIAAIGLLLVLGLTAGLFLWGLTEAMGQLLGTRIPYAGTVAVLVAFIPFAWLLRWEWVFYLVFCAFVLTSSVIRSYAPANDLCGFWIPLSLFLIFCEFWRKHYGRRESHIEGVILGLMRLLGRDQQARDRTDLPPSDETKQS